MDKRVRIVIISVCIVLLTGCWDKKEIEQRAFVYGAAIDVAENSSAGSGEIEFTQQLIVPENLTNMGGGGGGGSGPAFRNLSHTGKTISDISREMMRQASRHTDITQLNVILFSEEIASKPKQFEQSMDVFLREKDSRRSIKVAIASGKAKELLTVEPEHEKIPAEYITKELEARGNLEILDIVTVGDIQEKLLTKESFPLPQIKMQDSKIIEYEGVAVYNGHKDQVVGTLKGEEAKAFSFIRGQKHTGTVNVEVNHETATMEILEIKRHLSLEKKGFSNLNFSLVVDLKGKIAEQIGTENVMNEQVLREFEDALKKKSEEIIKKTLETLQTDLQTDAAGFGVYLHHYHPKLWDSLKNDWDSGEYYFSKSQVDVRVNVIVDRPGNINRTAVDGGSGK